jgi:hypothetical protein
MSLLMPSSAAKEQLLAAAGRRGEQRSDPEKSQAERQIGCLLNHPRRNKIVHPVLLVALLSQMAPSVVSICLSDSADLPISRCPDPS